MNIIAEKNEEIMASQVYPTNILPRPEVDEQPPLHDSSSCLGRTWTNVKQAVSCKSEGPSYWGWEATRRKIPPLVGEIFLGIGATLALIGSSCLLIGAMLLPAPMISIPALFFIVSGAGFLGSLFMMDISARLSARELNVAEEIENKPLLETTRLRGYYERGESGTYRRISWEQVFDYYQCVKTPEAFREKLRNEMNATPNPYVYAHTIWKELSQVNVPPHLATKEQILCMLSERIAPLSARQIVTSFEIPLIKDLPLNFNLDDLLQAGVISEAEYIIFSEGQKNLRSFAEREEAAKAVVERILKANQELPEVFQEEAFSALRQNINRTLDLACKARDEALKIITEEREAFLIRLDEQYAKINSGR